MSYISIRTKKQIITKLWKTKKKYFLNNARVLYNFSKDRYGLFLTLILINKFLMSEILYIKEKNISAKEQNYWMSDLNFNIDKDKLHYKNSYKFDDIDAFSFNVAIWKKFFHKEKLIKKNINYLEIGSYEGRSSVFVLESLPNSYGIFVDPFIEYDETKRWNLEHNSFSKIHENFLLNISNFEGRYKFYRCLSDEYFIQSKDLFDLIFIDGSHYGPDVYKDAMNGFKILKKDGYIIFDDFFWFAYDQIEENPMGGILKFISENKKNLILKYVSSQLIVQKT